MATKAWLFLSLIVIVFIASEVAARDLAENSTGNKNKDKEEEMQTEQNDGPLPPTYGGRGPLPPTYGGGVPAPGGGRSGGYGGRGRAYCPYGCCNRNYYGGCLTCCAYAGEAVQAHPGSTEPAH
ncbi:hypothetical protein AALP_AAs71754U000100 [Arabis alpina]|uniref:Glycine-rich protein n=1 Tax=Arabis alpina TaxID=50452 RepID=A0A087G3N0_ARAAL|nr:hypothetical protein AALP_AAs71754U000100 [Arabis alpina]